MSFLSQSNLILRDADHEFYQLFIRSLLRQARSLRGNLASTDGVVRLQVVIALTMTGLSLSGDLSTPCISASYFCPSHEKNEIARYIAIGLSCKIQEVQILRDIKSSRTI